MPQKMFRLTDEQVNRLKTAAQARGCTQTDLVREFIDSLGDECGDTQRDTQRDTREPYACHTPENTADTPHIPSNAAVSAAVEALTEQLAVKDRQIADLSAALVSAQKSVEQAHALHAADKQAVLAEPAAPAGGQTAAVQAPSRWRRLREAWRG